MTTPIPRWTAETEELVARAWLASVDTGGERLTLENVLPASREAYLEIARTALTALADAGALIPVGGETRQEWRIWIREHGPFYRLDGEDVTPTNAREHFERRRSEGYPDPGTLQTRIVCETRWREVTDDPA